ncbi:hypothetical protein [Aquimarina agarilytica]|uniref:hypothetical protein n=1 Tax=Aquimarina agarilytica TaxID=1087449 RepID=UPI000287CDD2|nr:hypothetical protein [Aquimarina agarilytica]
MGLKLHCKKINSILLKVFIFWCLLSTGAFAQCEFEFSVTRDGAGVYTVTVTSDADRGSAFLENLVSSQISVSYPVTAGTVTNFTNLASAVSYTQGNTFIPNGQTINEVTTWGYTSANVAFPMTAGVPNPLFSFELTNTCSSGIVSILPETPLTLQDDMGGTFTVGLFQSYVGNGPGNADVCVGSSVSCLDTDGDSVADIDDFDDDNDGVLDRNECIGFLSQNTNGTWKGRTSSTVTVDFQGSGTQSAAVFLMMGK